MSPSRGLVPQIRQYGEHAAMRGGVGDGGRAVSSDFRSSDGRADDGKSLDYRRRAGGFGLEGP